MSGQFRSDSQIVINALEAYKTTSLQGECAVINQPPLEQLVQTLGLAEHMQAGDLAGQALARFVDDYLHSTTRLHHPGFLAHQVAASQSTGALGSLIDGFTNNAMAIYEMGPAASAIEYFMLNWMLQKVGWRTVPVAQQSDPDSDHAGGVLTHGGSLANLTALLAARSARVPGFWQQGNPGNLVVLVPEQSHYSMKRAVAIIGLGEANCIKIGADSNGRIDPGQLSRQVDQLERDGQRVMAIVANACGTAAGLYDPLDAVADICEAHHIWLHVDAAHGGGALVSNRLRPLMDGIERADSLIWDAHKMLCTPTVCAAVLVRDHRSLDHAFEQEASYLMHDKAQPGFDFISRTVECTKAGLGLKLFMSLASLGEKRLEQHVDQLVEMAQQAAELIGRQPDFEVAIQPETNILCFRTRDGDTRQLEIRRLLLEQGHFYISSTEYRGVRWLRLVFMNHQTSIADIERLLVEIRQIRSVFTSA